VLVLILIALLYSVLIGAPEFPPRLADRTMWESPWGSRRMHNRPRRRFSCDFPDFDGSGTFTPIFFLACIAALELEQVVLEEI
jgi:hypothetical protein